MLYINIVGVTLYAEVTTTNRTIPPSFMQNNTNLIAACIQQIFSPLLCAGLVKKQYELITFNTDSVRY
jgi:hypothetical protein